MKKRHINAIYDVFSCNKRNIKVVDGWLNRWATAEKCRFEIIKCWNGAHSARIMNQIGQCEITQMAHAGSVHRTHIHNTVEINEPFQHDCIFECSSARDRLRFTWNHQLTILEIDLLYGNGILLDGSTKVDFHYVRNRWSLCAAYNFHIN